MKIVLKNTATDITACCINILLMKNLMVTNHGSDKNVMDEEVGASREGAGAVDTDL